ncbi:MAG: LysM peptidoglycan-binding domain-containing protein, partial [Candidatus Delongbacteria bacterium]
VEIYKDEILDNSERKFLDLLNHYRNGELLAAKITFDNLLETLEYLYGDNKVSDKVMLKDFWDEFSNQSIKNSADIFEIYSSLFSDENLFSKDKEPRELVIEKKGSDKIAVRQNNQSYLYLKEKTEDIFAKFGKKADEEFIKSVYDHYIDHLSDRIGIRETFIRSQKYINFITSKLSTNGLNSIFSYLPAAKTSFYDGSRNGGIWRLENIRKYRNIRSDIGASTAEVIRRIKSLRSNNNDLLIIASLLEKGRYDISADELTNTINTDKFANFISLAVILGNPEDHDLETADIDNEEEKTYFSSYENYIENPKEFSKSKKSVKSTASKSRTSFIRINYKVKRGDNLQKIADLFDVNLSDLRQWNPKDTSKKYLYPGMVLYIKGYNFQYYKARSGDSIGKIAGRYKMTIGEFKAINDLTSSTIYKGRRYIVKKR